MPLVTLTELLELNKNENWAIGAVDVMNQDMVRGVIAGAEKANAPVILMLAEVHEALVSIEELGAIMVDCARRATVPVCVHFDHGETYSSIIRAMKAGFTSVMYDGSHLPLEENIRTTKEIVQVAQALGVSVEAELGQLTRPEGCDDEDLEENPDLYTDPEEAIRFYHETGIDALAVAFGTAHGVYAKQPVLDFDRLQEIRNKTGAPLVMHGGSGLEPADFHAAIDRGVKKINYYSNMVYSVAQTIQCKLNEAEGKTYYHDISVWAIEAIRDDIAETLTRFRSNGKA
ncbi:class II fructose-bisphosphate aldolase [Pontiella agarivorans]|uniref:Class II fructose-bisphosphate aldolase n=1 Tax=Pontiella agarivorans TaxID=3038953 RepID=A0ABU5MW49_9BACT|nr:class II fructose-bisphosphate aldolase [Pontiella agarivorans]MDZ8118395.1 class II fructose-bisphosphate aldolase [Pontiella agarivorans]